MENMSIRSSRKTGEEIHISNSVRSACRKVAASDASWSVSPKRSIIIPMGG